MSRYIDADATRNLLIKSISLTNGIDTALKAIPSIDIVRCGECKWHSYDTDDECRWRIEEIPKDDDFCSRGERRE